MKKILMFNNAPELISDIQAAAPGWELVDGMNPIEDSELETAEIVVGWGRIIAKCVEKGKSLRWVQSWSAGVDAFPLDLLRDKGIILTNASGVHAAPIAESIFSMMLAFARGLTAANTMKRDKKWRFTEGLWEIHGQTIGILGAGEIGLETARLAKAFNMRTLGLRRSGNPAVHIDHMYTMSELETLLPQCDFVVNILPYTKETHQVMNARSFAAMKPSAAYISVGRGPTTDYDALTQALRDKSIAFAGLDVTVPEPLPSDNPLWDFDNVIITPHFSGSTQHYQSRAGGIFIENLKAYIKDGKPIRNIVNLDRGY